MHSHLERIDVRTDDGVMDCHVAAPEGNGSWPAVITYMDAFGIRPQLLAMAERLSGHGYVVVVPNLYYRTGAFEPFDPRQVTSEGPERNRFRAMIASITHAQVMRDTAAVIAQIDQMAQVGRGPLGVVGYCMGGGYALSAAGTFPDRVAAAASFHGGSLATDKPDSPHRLAPAMRARLYIGAAEEDATFPPEQQARLEQALTAAQVAFALEVYRGARHGFAVNGHLMYKQEAAEQHWNKLLELFRDVLPGLRVE